MLQCNGSLIKIQYELYAKKNIFDTACAKRVFARTLERTGSCPKSRFALVVSKNMVRYFSNTSFTRLEY